MDSHGVDADRERKTGSQDVHCAGSRIQPHAPRPRHVDVGRQTAAARGPRRARAHAGSCSTRAANCPWPSSTLEQETDPVSVQLPRPGRAQLALLRRQPGSAGAPARQRLAQAYPHGLHRPALWQRRRLRAQSAAARRPRPRHRPGPSNTTTRGPATAISSSSTSVSSCCASCLRTTAASGSTATTARNTGCG